jgi:hypothetical protein
MAGNVEDSGDRDSRQRLVTVAHVREREKYAEVMFHESARIYRLLRANPDYAATLRELRAAAAERRPLRVRFVVQNGDVLEAVRL